MTEAGSRSVQIFAKMNQWFATRQSLKASGKTIGFVPTMGALHEGHLSLVKRSRAENDITVVSIFVNPTQFNDPKDFKNYPRTNDADLKLLNEAQADILLLPELDELYADNFRYQVTESDFSKILCGAHRPGHFTGVLTVVMKLLNISGADRAYFGEKDYQQLTLIQGMAKTFFMPTEIVPCPTTREKDGLAMSSRNVRLTAEERKRASLLPELLRSGLTCEEIANALTNAGFKVDYVEEHFNRRFAAAALGDVRLIDNVSLSDSAAASRNHNVLKERSL